MGDIADMILDGILDQYTGEYIGDAVGYPRSMSYSSRNYSPKQRMIRKELALLIKEKYKLCITQKQKNAAVNEARREINLKYGHNWRYVAG